MPEWAKILVPVFLAGQGLLVYWTGGSRASPRAAAALRIPRLLRRMDGTARRSNRCRRSEYFARRSLIEQNLCAIGPASNRWASGGLVPIPACRRQPAPFAQGVPSSLWLDAGVERRVEPGKCGRGTHVESICSRQPPGTRRGFILVSNSAPRDGRRVGLQILAGGRRASRPANGHRVGAHSSGRNPGAGSTAREWTNSPLGRRLILRAPFIRCSVRNCRADENGNI